MVSTITTGNAITDGRDFGYWIAGRMDKWCKDRNIPFEPDTLGLRNTGNLEINWGIYKKGEKRTDWAPCSNKTAMSILIRGDLVFTFRDSITSGKLKETRFKTEGDYVIWREDLQQHTWRMEQASVILTLRW
jgi:hypothetical protein